MYNFKSHIDARIYPPREKHTKIFETYNNLLSNEVMELINDHDPKPLYYQFMAEFPNQFEWEYIEQGPEIWKVAIIKK